MITSPTFARDEVDATLDPILIFVPINDVATAEFVRVWNPSVRLVAVPPVAREVLVISGVPTERPLVQLYNWVPL